MAKFNNEKSEVLSYRDKEIQRPSNKDKNIKWRYQYKNRPLDKNGEGQRISINIKSICRK